MAEETTINSLQGLVEVVLKINKQFHGQVWWRGQKHFNMLLRPSVLREEVISRGGYQYEQSVTTRFMQKAPSRCEAIPDKSNYFEWLLLMQHHGLPTQLLDWTESPLFACYFAVNAEDFPFQDGALFALSPYSLNEQQVGEPDMLLPTHQKVAQLVRKPFTKQIRKDVDRVVGILPAEIDIRVMMQLSVFTVHGSCKPLEEYTNSDLYLRKFRIPGNNKKQMREELKFMGVHEANLFPDLDHLANETKILRFKPPERMIDIWDGILPLVVDKPMDTNPST
ncbi:MAG: FRG domain-containing protein [Anaerolineaceae bacterium]|nr:FRG domain-containing protein [Anaerolineaceae bacterium]